MKKFLQTNFIWIQGLLSFLLIFVVGFYINLLSGGYRDYQRIWTAIQSLGSWNFLVFLAFFLFLFQIYLSYLPYKDIKTLKKRIIEQILEAASRSLIYPNKDMHIRAVITICDYKKNIRRTTYSYNIQADPERTATFPIDFGVTGEALRIRAAVSKSLPRNHILTYPQDVQLVIAPELRCVLAVPIFDPRNPAGNIIGILAFDSFERIKNIEFDKRESKVIAQSWADVISEVLIV